jgi:Ca2+-binding EF-hand superfamily protein
VRPHRAALLVLALAAVLAVPALAADSRAFAESDRNGDGNVDRREAERRALDVFSFVDNDKDAYLSRDEYNALVLDESFAAVDADRDGRISTHEFVTMRYREFDAADKNHDGILTEEERAASPPPAATR